MVPDVRDSRRHAGGTTWHGELDFREHLQGVQVEAVSETSEKHTEIVSETSEKHTEIVSETSEKPQYR